MDPQSFFADPDQLFISMQIRILSQLYKICKKLPYEVLKKTKKNAQKLKTMELVHINLIFLNKSTLITIFLAFFQFFPPKFTPLDSGGKMNADPCGSGSTALVRSRSHLFAWSRSRLRDLGRPEPPKKVLYCMYCTNVYKNVPKMV